MTLILSLLFGFFLGFFVMGPLLKALFPKLEEMSFWWWFAFIAIAYTLNGGFLWIVNLIFNIK